MAKSAEIRHVLDRLDRGEPVGVQEVANALARRWPAAVIVAVLEHDQVGSETAMAFAWRGNYFAGLGMLTKLQQVMVEPQHQYALNGDAR